MRRLNEAGHAVVALVRATDAGVVADGIEQRCGDVTNLDAMTQAVAGCDAVVHAARTRRTVRPHRRVLRRERARHRPSSGGLRDRRRAQARLSPRARASCIDHGDLNGVNETQRMPARAPTPYLATKAIAERHVLAASGRDFATVALRPHLLWGPGENIAAAAARRAREGRASCASSAKPARRSTAATSTTPPTRIWPRSNVSSRRRDRRQGVLHHAGRAGDGRRLLQRTPARGRISRRNATSFGIDGAHARIDRPATTRVLGSRSAGDRRLRSRCSARRPGSTSPPRGATSVTAARRDGRRLRARFRVSRARAHARAVRSRDSE